MTPLVRPYIHMFTKLFNINKEAPGGRKYEPPVIEKFENPLDVIIDSINNNNVRIPIDEIIVDLIFVAPTIAEAPRDSRKPISVYAIYNDDLNILTIHKAVRAKYAININNEPFRYLSEWNEYCGKVRDCIEDYIRISTQKFEDITDEEVREFKLSLINMYILMAKKYITINSHNIAKTRDKCGECGACLSEGYLIDINGMSACPKCGKEFRESIKLCVYTENNRLDANSKNIYEDLTNFLKRIDAYEGKQKNKPPIAIVKQLTDFFDIDSDKTLIGGKFCSEIKDMKTNAEKKEYTSIRLLEVAFKETKNTAYYKDIELVANWLWGWHFPDISDIKKEIIADYITAQKAYDHIKERESSLNINLRLIYHLKARGFACEVTDFKIITSSDSINYHRRMFKEISKITGIPYVKFI